MLRLVSRVTHELVGDRPVLERPAASIPSTSTSRPVRPSIKWPRGGSWPGARAGGGSPAPPRRSRLGSRSGTRRACPVRWEAISWLRGHRRALVGEDPDIALRAGQPALWPARPPAVGITGGGQRQRPQHAIRSLPIRSGGRGRVQPVEQRERLARLILGQQHPGQHQMPLLARVIRLVTRAEAVLPRPPAAASRSPCASSSRARCAGTGLNRPGGPGEACSASPIAVEAPATSPLACRIHASATSPPASGGV